MKISAFNPASASTVVLDAGTSSTNALVNPPFQAPEASVPVAKFFNGGEVIAFVEIGGPDVIATVPVAGASGTNGTPGSMPLGPGESKVVAIGSQTNVAAITAAGSAQVYITPGFGT